MAQVLPDIIPQSQVYREYNLAGQLSYARLVRMFRVIFTDAEIATMGTNYYLVQSTAIAQSGVPTVNTLHPDTTNCTGMSVRNYQVHPVSGGYNQVDIAVAYEYQLLFFYDTVWNVDVSTSLITVDTCKEWNSDYTALQNVELWYNSLGVKDSAVSTPWFKQMAHYPATFPTISCTYTRTISSENKTALLQGMIHYVDAYNSATFNPMGIPSGKKFGFPASISSTAGIDPTDPGYWLMTMADINTNKVNGMKLATLVFTFNIFKWNRNDIVFAIDYRTGERFENACLGTDNQAGNNPLGSGDNTTNGYHICRAKHPMDLNNMLSLVS